MCKIPLVWIRYIDDIFFMWTHLEEELDDFFNFCNTYNPDIKFDPTPPGKSIPFLVVNATIENGKLVFGLYTKSMDSHLYLRWSSCHPIHTERNLPYCLSLRVRRICTKISDFENHAKEMNRTYWREDTR